MSDEPEPRATTRQSSLATHHSLFVYGTLMDDAVVAQLVGRCLPKRTATLHGYRKVTPVGDYPYIVVDPTARVDGTLLLDVDAAALRAFDHYEDEGHLYRRIGVEVDVGNDLRSAWVYVGVRVGTGGR